MLHHIVAHRADPDGIVSHAILRRALAADHRLEHYFAEYGDLPETFEALLQADPGKVIVADIAIQSDNRDEALFRSIKDRHEELEWYDHHKGSQEWLPTLERHCDRVVIDMGKCGAELVVGRYAADDPHSQHLAALGHAHDFERKKSPLAVQAYGLQDIIASGFDLLTLVGDLAEERVLVGKSAFTPPYQEVLGIFAERKQQAYHELESTVEHEPVGRYNVTFAFSPKILYMKDAPDYLPTAHPEQDIIVVMYDGLPNVIIYGRKGRGVGKRIPDFCQLNGGGGRGHGGGFVLDHAVTPETYAADKAYVTARLGEFLEQL